MKITYASITNHNGAHVLAEGLAALEAGATSLDFSGVQRCDTTALACILAWRRRAQARGTPLTLEAVPANLDSLARLCGIETLLRMHPAQPQAQA